MLTVCTASTYSYASTVWDDSGAKKIDSGMTLQPKVKIPKRRQKQKRILQQNQPTRKKKQKRNNRKQFLKIKIIKKVRLKKQLNLQNKEDMHI